MRSRSLLFVRGDSERKFADAVTLGADILILDLEDSVAPVKKPEARAHVVSLLEQAAARDWKFFFRINPLDAGPTWGADDLAAAIGATTNKNADGARRFAYQVARTQCLFAASSNGFDPLDTLFTDFRDSSGPEEDCRQARRDGFAGRIAIHPDQVAIINKCFSPSPEDIAHGQKILGAFAANPQAGTIGIDGQIYEIPHLQTAHRTLAAAGITQDSMQ